MGHLGFCLCIEILETLSIFRRALTRPLGVLSSRTPHSHAERLILNGMAAATDRKPHERVAQSEPFNNVNLDHAEKLITYPDGVFGIHSLC